MALLLLSFTPSWPAARLQLPSLTRCPLTCPTCSAPAPACRWWVQDLFKVITYWIVLKFDIFQVGEGCGAVVHG